MKYDYFLCRRIISSVVAALVFLCGDPGSILRLQVELIGGRDDQVHRLAPQNSHLVTRLTIFWYISEPDGTVKTQDTLL